MAIEQIRGKKDIVYDIVQPPEGWQPKMLWWVARDELGEQICKKLRYRPLANDRVLISLLADRNQEALQVIGDYLPMGRSLVFSLPDGPVVGGVEYGQIELGGFGSPKITPEGLDASNVCRRDLTEPNYPPSADNFLSARPRMTSTSYIDRDGVWQSDRYIFSFTGAYTLEQVVSKLAINLVVLSKLVDIHNLPFLVPFPLCVGQYPQVVGPNNKPAYFIAFRIPYGGNRSGIVNLDTMSPENNARTVARLKESIHVVSAVRALHDLIGLGHYQLVGGNFLSVPSGLDYLADWSTAKIIWPTGEDTARALDLSQVPLSLWKMITTMDPNINPVNLAAELVSETLRLYLHEEKFSFTIKPEGLDLGAGWLMMLLPFIQDRLRKGQITSVRLKKAQQIERQITNTKKRLLKELDV
ncbi:MAG: hypothetical protein WC489_02275 [Patescibacteria group bacterium]